MLPSRRLNKKINRIHDRALRLARNDELSLFGELLNKYKSVTNYRRNKRVLETDFHMHQILGKEERQKC